MTEEEAKKTPPKDDKKARLADALKRNLQRRKASDNSGKDKEQK